MEVRLKVTRDPMQLMLWDNLRGWQAVMVVAALTAFFVILCITGDTKGAAAVTVFITVITFAAVIDATILLTRRIPSIDKRTIWISRAGEFLLILLPMLWVLRG